MKKAIEILMYLWQFPQNLLGLLLLDFFRPEEAYDYKGVRLYYATRMPGGISLGRYIIVAYHTKDYTGKTEAHEWGHTRQSRMLGGFYLFVIGIPSLVWAAWHRRHKERSYYWFYTERWADKLGGVKR